MWHIDATVIRLLDGTRAYLHAVINNFSRRILAWRVPALRAARIDPIATPRKDCRARRKTVRDATVVRCPWRPVGIQLRPDPVAGRRPSAPWMWPSPVGVVGRWRA